MYNDLNFQNSCPYYRRWGSTIDSQSLNATEYWPVPTEISNNHIQQDNEILPIIILCYQSQYSTHLWSHKIIFCHYSPSHYSQRRKPFKVDLIDTSKHNFTQAILFRLDYTPREVNNAPLLRNCKPLRLLETPTSLNQCILLIIDECFVSGRLKL